jgi:REP element-mobilizing transposase RayT
MPDSDDVFPKSGSTGVPPVSAFKIARRNLPHWQEPGRVYFLSWTCRKGLILSANERSIVLKALRYWHGRKWGVFAAVVMPDHVHLLAQPLSHPQGGSIDLGEIIHSVKSFSVHQINRGRRRRGPVWEQERYDRIIRDEIEFLENWQYIKNNPLKQGIVSEAESYTWLYEQEG